MKTDIIKQEILLVITTFSRKELCEKNGQQNLHHQSHAEQLEEACCNGLLDELLSGIVEISASGKRLSLWDIQQGKSLLKIELCDYPQIIEKHLSINPHIFLPIMIQN
jgi:hypothetical protein